jgi:hypothetical protein
MTSLSYHFRSDGYTVRETAEALNIECLSCGELLIFTPHGRTNYVSQELHSHRSNCGPVSILQCIAASSDSFRGALEREGLCVLSNRFPGYALIDRLFNAIRLLGVRVHRAAIRMMNSMEER